MNFLARYERVLKRGRRVELLRSRCNHLIQNDPTNKRIDAVATTFDKADARYAQALANLEPDVIVMSY